MVIFQELLWSSLAAEDAAFWLTSSANLIQFFGKEKAYFVLEEWKELT